MRIIIIALMLVTLYSCDNESSESLPKSSRFSQVEDTTNENSLHEFPGRPRGRNSRGGSSLAVNKLAYGQWSIYALEQIGKIDMQMAETKLGKSPILIAAQNSPLLESVYGRKAYEAILIAADTMAQRHARYFAESYTINPVALDSLMNGNTILPESIPIFIRRN